MRKYLDELLDLAISIKKTSPSLYYETSITKIVQNLKDFLYPSEYNSKEYCLKLDLVMKVLIFNCECDYLDHHVYVIPSAKELYETFYRDQQKKSDDIKVNSDVAIRDQQVVITTTITTVKS